MGIKNKAIGLMPKIFIKISCKSAAYYVTFCGKLMEQVAGGGLF